MMTANQEQVDYIYRLYPNKCPVRGASSGKSLKNKQKIARLLTIEGYSYGYITYAIERYVDDCIKNRVYMKNFGTFLNNIPDYCDDNSPLVKSDEERYLTIEERQNPDDNFRERLIYERKFN